MVTNRISFQKTKLNYYYCINYIYIYNLQSIVKAEKERRCRPERITTKVQRFLSSREPPRAEDCWARIACRAFAFLLVMASVMLSSRGSLRQELASPHQRLCLTNANNMG
jgi:hypothetical protein